MQIMTVLTLAEAAARGSEPAKAGWARLVELHTKYQEPSAEEWDQLHATAIEARQKMEEKFAPGPIPASAAEKPAA